MDIDDIEHDPYVLMSILTAWFGGEWTMDEAEAVLGTLFDRQYILTETVQTYGEGEDEYTVCTITLENFDLSHLPVYIFPEEKLSLYAMYMGTLGNRPDLFPDSEYIAKYIRTPSSNLRYQRNTSRTSASPR